MRMSGVVAPSALSYSTKDNMEEGGGGGVCVCKCVCVERDKGIPVNLSIRCEDRK